MERLLGVRQEKEERERERELLLLLDPQGFQVLIHADCATRDRLGRQFKQTLIRSDIYLSSLADPSAISLLPLYYVCIWWSLLFSYLSILLSLSISISLSLSILSLSLYISVYSLLFSLHTFSHPHTHTLSLSLFFFLSLSLYFSPLFSSLFFSSLFLYISSLSLALKSISTISLCSLSSLSLSCLLVFAPSWKEQGVTCPTWGNFHCHPKSAFWQRWTPTTISTQNWAGLLEHQVRMPSQHPRQHCSISKQQRREFLRLLLQSAGL